MLRGTQTSPFLAYLATASIEDQEERLPALNDISKELGLGLSALREQLEVARALGFVEVRPRTGIRRLPYSFFPAVQQSLTYAIKRSPMTFEAFADLRNHLEAAYWYEAVKQLQDEDKVELQSLIKGAWAKLSSPIVQIPHDDHRNLHLVIFRRLENPYVQGILEAYWDAYEAIGLNVYTDLKYLQDVWHYHQVMVDAICAGNYQAGLEALVEHKDLLFHRPGPIKEDQK